jgi:hypothetical protein
MKKAKLIKGIVGAAITVGPVVSDWANEKLNKKKYILIKSIMVW